MESPRSRPSVIDVLVAAALTVAVQLELWLPDVGHLDDTDLAPDGPTQLLVAGLALAMTLALTWRRSFPLVALAFAIPTVALSGSGGLDGSPALAIALMVLLYSVGSYARDGMALLGALGVGGLLVAAILRDPDARLDVGDLLLPVAILGGSWAAGVAQRIRRDRETDLEERARVLERDRDARSRAAVEEERGRIARELHDVVAHAIGIIVLQARGGRRSLAEDPAASREALDAIEATGVQALAEMRRLVEVLRADDDVASLAPAPGLRDLETLVATVRDAGLPVELRVEGDPVAVPPGVDLSAYRIIQEALTNALRHAGPASASVRVRYAGPALELEISDTGQVGGTTPGSGREGLGVVGMRERATLFGGTLAAEPLDGGGFTVRASLPLTVEPA